MNTSHDFIFKGGNLHGNLEFSVEQFSIFLVPSYANIKLQQQQQKQQNCTQRSFYVLLCENKFFVAFFPFLLANNTAGISSNVASFIRFSSSSYF